MIIEPNFKSELIVFTSYQAGELSNLFDSVSKSSEFSIAAKTFIQQFIAIYQPRAHRGSQADLPFTLFGDLGELLIYFILTSNGYSVSKPIPDHGVDFLAIRDNEKLAIQVKFRSNTNHEFDYVNDGISSFNTECNSNYKKKDGWEKVVVSNTKSKLIQRDIIWYGEEFINEQMIIRWFEFAVLFKSLW